MFGETETLVEARQAGAAGAGELIGRLSPIPETDQEGNAFLPAWSPRPQ